MLEKPYWISSVVVVGVILIFITVMTMVVGFCIIQTRRKKPSITVSKGITNYNNNNNDFITFLLTAEVYCSQSDNNRQVNENVSKHYICLYNQL